MPSRTEPFPRSFLQKYGELIFAGLLIGLMIIAVGYLTLSSIFKPAHVAAERAKLTPEEQFRYDYGVFVDPTTGCQYFWKTQNPRYKQDGTILCN